MRTWPEDNDDAVNRHVQQLHPRNRGTFKVYRSILPGFQRFVQQCPLGTAVSQATIQAWLHERAKHWTMRLMLHRARVVDRFLDFLASEGRERAWLARLTLTTHRNNVKEPPARIASPRGGQRLPSHYSVLPIKAGVRPG